ncbi:MAG: PKD domain-containing protein [Saprospiraceae bacterium]|nr:PKD domain-containing protein [Saprospiraceae bacterium]
MHKVRTAMGIRRLICIYLFYPLFILPCHLIAQCTYLAYDGFEAAAGTPLQGLSGGTGWAQPWFVQNGNVNVPGFQIQGASLTYSDLQTIHNKGIGGRDYLALGRRLNTADSGPFTYLVAENENGIGTETGDTLWLSFLIRKSNDNNEEVFADLHNNDLSWCSGCASQHLAVGYFGPTYHVSGQRRWHLRLNGNFYDTGIQAAHNTTYLMVMRLVFQVSNTEVALYVNPAELGFELPGSPTLTQQTNTENIIRSLALYLGNSPDNGAIDELRFATSYACVTPDAAVPVNLPPTAVFAPSQSTAQLPVTIQFDGSASTDPEGQSLTYQWNFGDGSPTQSGPAVVNHTFNVLGQIPVSLTVSDNLGLQHTTYQTLTLLDENNTFPCQTRITPIQLVSCGQGNGRLAVHAGSNTFVLRNQNNVSMPVVNGNEYHNLAAGQYRLYVSGNGNVCTDTFTVFMQVDSTTCPGWQPQPCAMDIGTNLSGFSDWSVERPMKNLLKHIRNEVIGYSSTCFCWNSNVTSQLSFDVNGYPTHAPQTTSAGTTYIRYVISADGGNFRADSNYVLLYDGIGTLVLSGNLTVTQNTPGRIAFRANDNENFSLSITFSDVIDHVRNIRIVRPQDEGVNLQVSPFYNVFLEKITPFRTLRFMDWGSTNGNANVSWAGRSLVSFFTHAGDRGVPYEVMIGLANETGKDIWLCVPHAADSAYIAQMATLFRDSLNEDIIIYLEYSNEVWNWIFPQAQYNDNNRPANLNYGRAMAEKAGKVFRIWHNVFGPERCRVRRVLGIQAGFNDLNEQILSQLPHEEWDFGSPTHYFGLDHGSSGNPRLDLLGASATVADVMSNAQNAWQGFRPSVKRDYNLIKIFGKEVITYEGGQHFVGNSFGIPYAYQQAMWDAQNDVLMYNVYNAMHDSIRSWGCKLACNFSLASPQESVYGSWGVLPDIDLQGPYATTARKYQAVLDNAAAVTCADRNVWTGLQDNSWGNICNWDKFKLPGAETDVVIPSQTPHSPQVDVMAVAKTVLLWVNAMLSIEPNFQLLLTGQ